jgi:NAD(P)-dependent dehydrogenase (short-subunit alcohol dehydrogenase family)
MKLSGNTIFITGGGSGIGPGLAEALHKLGNKVIIAGRRRGHLDAVISVNPGMEAVELDIIDPTSINQVAATLIAEHPDLNILINSAASCCLTPPAEGSMTRSWSPFLHPIAALHAARHECSRARDRAALGAHRTYEQP